MKRSLSFTDLKDLTDFGQDTNTRNVRKIQSCAGRFQETDLSPDFFDELLDEYEQQDVGDTMTLNLVEIKSTELSGNMVNQFPLPEYGTTTPTNKPLFTTHDLTLLLSFVQANPPSSSLLIPSITSSSTITTITTTTSSTDLDLT